MMKSLLLTLCFLFIHFSNSFAQTEPVRTKDSVVNKGVTDKNCAVEMSFGSYGSGIDGAALDKLEALIKDKKLSSSTKPVGREGERRVCLPLTELNGKARKKFIESLKKIAHEGKLVSVSIR